MTGSGATKPVRQHDERQAGDENSLSLLSPGGPFENFPGPVLVVARNGVVLSANAQAEPVAQLLQGGMTVELRDALNAALAGKVAQVTPLLLGRREAIEEIGQALDLVALPWAEGAAVLLLGRDITLERSLRSALIDSRQRYKDLVEASSDFAWEVDAAGRFTFVSPRGALGYTASELVGQSVRDFLMETDEAESSPFTTRMPVDQVEVWFRDADGKAACLSATGLPLHGPEGEWLGVRGTCRDITAERAREAALARARHRQQLLAYILRMVRDELEPARLLMAAAEALVPALPALGVAIYCRGPDGVLACVAQAGSEPPQAMLAPLLTRLDAGEELLEARDEAGCLLLRATRYQGQMNGALCLLRGGPEDAPGEEETMLLDELSAQIGVTNQVLAREEELEKLSSTDPMTGLLNRRSFMDQLEQHFARPGGRAQSAALFYLDLDNFKLVNDRHGHQAGDRALLALTEILRNQSRTGDLAARLGGDEFALFCAGMPAAIAEKKGGALLEAAATLADFTADPELPLGLSVGIAVFDPGTAEDLRSLLDRADAAMYAVKRNGKGGLELAPPKKGGAAT
jgi:diguanylate cyclase (GGDEF)-like protein/PAS domain S-box-containing protein